MSARFHINLLMFFFGFFLALAAGSALAQCTAEQDATTWAAQNYGSGGSCNCGAGCIPSFANMCSVSGSGVQIAGVSVYTGQSSAGICPSLLAAQVPTSGPASDGANGCNAGVSSGYSIPTPSGIGPLSVAMGGCVYTISTQAGNADGTRVGGIAVSTGVTAVTAPAASASVGSAAAAGERRVINIDGSTTVTTVKLIGDGAGGTLTQVTETTTPAGGGAPVTSTSIGSGGAAPGGAGGGGGGAGGGGSVGGLGTSSLTGGDKPHPPMPTATAFVAPASGTLPAAPGSWYTSKYPGGINGVWDARKTQLFATPLGGALANMSVPEGSGSEPVWQFTLWGINGTHSLSLPSWIWAVVKAILLLSAAFACRRIIFGG